MKQKTARRILRKLAWKIARVNSGLASFSPSTSKLVRKAIATVVKGS